MSSMACQMRFVISNEIIVINPTKPVIDYVKNNLVLENSEHLKKQQMGFYTGNTPRHIHYYKKVGTSIIIPYGCIDDIRHIIKENEWEVDFADVPVEHIPRNEIKLRDYQVAAVEAMYNAKNGILISPTGSGKSVCGMALIGKIGQKSLWICNTTELANQAMDTYKNLFEASDGDLGFIREGNVEIGEKLTVAVVHTLSKVDIDRHTWGCVVADEIQFAIKSITNTAMFSRCLEMVATPRKYGLTALLHRSSGDEQRVKMLVGNIKHEVPRHVVADNIMTPKLQRIDTGVEPSRAYLATDGTVEYVKLVGYIAEHQSRNQLIANNVAKDILAGHSCLVLCDRVSQIEMIYDMLSAMPEVADKVCMVTGSMTSKKGKAEREKAIEDMRSGVKRCLVASVALAGTGLDIVRLNKLHFVSLQKDAGKILQAAGRVSRAFEGKAQPEILDYVDEQIGYCVGAFKKRVRTYKKVGIK